MSGEMTSVINAQMGETSGHVAQGKSRFVPLIRNLKIRTTIGFCLLLLSSELACHIHDKGRLGIIVLILCLAWLPAVFFTDKYVHKYPQRYFTYLIAAHLKAGIIMAPLLWIIGIVAGPVTAPRGVLWTGFTLFVFADAFVSALRRSDMIGRGVLEGRGRNDTEAVSNERCSDSVYANSATLSSVNKQAVVNQVRSNLDKPLVEFIENNLPDLEGEVGNALILDDMTDTNAQAKSGEVGLLVARTRLNDVRRLNQFLQFCTMLLAMGGYIAVRYMPFENVVRDLKRRHAGVTFWPIFILHFIWYRAIPKIPWMDKLYFSPKMAWLDRLHLSVTKRRNRVLSKAEVWGRLAYCGMEVAAESEGDGDRYLIARRVACPVRDRKTSYYPIVALEKVGLDGGVIHLHKIRTMYPFSEFLQKRIFEDHGLASTGKFANDFRLTDYGKFIRKYWLDELPQIFDWLRGDVKLVGMRATSRHFLSLYPKELYDLYVQIKPGLVPPIFDESTNGFDDIIKVELTYLKRYWDQPFRTDVRYFIRTFTDIAFRGVRSK